MCLRLYKPSLLGEEIRGGKKVGNKRKNEREAGMIRRERKEAIEETKK
jgi:hypothetical protein